jgi:hypothetical protein
MPQRKNTKPTASHPKRGSRRGQPSTVAKTPPELAYKYTPPELEPLPRNVPLPSVEDGPIIRALECGMLMSEIARKIDRDIGEVSRYLAQPQRATRTREARRLSAVFWDEEAQRVVQELPDNATPAQCLKARELASHFRWRAKCIAPQDYGDRPALDAEAEAARQAQALGSEAARLAVAGVLAAIGLAVVQGEPAAIPGTARTLPPGT